MFRLGGECWKRRYSTKLSKQDCIVRLQNKNWLYDAFDYEYCEKGGAHFVLIQRPLNHWGNAHSIYRVEFTPGDSDTAFRVCYENVKHSFSWLTDTWLDEFFCGKLDAVPPES